MNIGMDIGGTNVRIVATDSLTNPDVRNKIAYRSGAEYGINLRQIIENINSFGGTVNSIGIGAPGKLSNDKTAIISTRCAGQWLNKPLVRDLKNTFDCPVIMEGDSVTAALGEALFGTNTRQDFRFITYGTGIGSSIVTFRDNKPRVQKITDAEHAAYINPWQQECGGRGIENTIGKPASSLTDAEWVTVMSKFHGHLLQFLEYFKPSTLVFGGGIATKQWPRVQAVIDQVHSEHPEQHVDITLTKLGEDAGLYGALSLLRDT